jgi:4'-phosphopantetheinyl transferase
MLHQAPNINILSTEWQPAFTAPSLKNDQVHVWRVFVDQVVSRLPTISVLSVDEETRSERFRSPQDSERFAITRSLLRILLSRYLDLAPMRLRFTYGGQGKPRLADEFNSACLQFNLSHSEGIALYAITRGRNIGIDVERVREAFDYREIARRFLAVEEPDLQIMSADAFFRRWTRSEALAKAMGGGLDQFSIAKEKEPGYRVVELMPEPGFVAALAVESDSFSVECLDWKMD